MAARELRVAPEVAATLPASHLAQLQQDVAADDNVCLVCGALIEAGPAELVVLHDDRATLARLAHAACARSGVYEWEGTSAAVAQLTLRPDGVDVATALVWRTHTIPRAIVLLEPRIHISLDADDADADPLQTLFAAPLGLHPASGTLERLRPRPAPVTTIQAAADGLRVHSDALRVSVPARPETLRRWRAHLDGGRALVLLGRGLGITGPEAQLATTLGEALLTRPCWAAAVAVA